MAPRGPTIATLAVHGSRDPLSRSGKLTAAIATWTVDNYGKFLGFSVNDDATELLCPSDRPEGIIAMEVVANDDFCVSIMSWFGESYNHNGDGRLVIHLTEDERLALFSRNDAYPRYISAYGSLTMLSGDQTITLCAIF